MRKILVTGGAGYIGSHTIVALIESGYEVVSIDNFGNSFPGVFNGIAQITGVQVQNYNIDLCDLDATEKVFTEHPDIEGVIHFAAYKYVNESIHFPFKYYDNNLTSLLNILNCCKQHDVKNFVFSSSCSVYGNAAEQPVSEKTPITKAESPYGQTKIICEQIIDDDVSSSQMRAAMLRYFNPIGAHPSGNIGETPKAKPQNILPIFTAVATGKMDQFTIAGNDYPTKDGTCLRDYIHVCDIADAHVLAYDFVSKLGNGEVETFNLGLGEGVSVLELVEAFETANKQDLHAQIGPRRVGDVAAVYSDSTKSKTILNWQPKFSLKDMMQSAWAWEQKE